MQELMGRVTALDPSVSQSLKVISYFDALVAGEVNLETLVRGAAALSGTVAGLSAPSGVVRVEASGRRLNDIVDGDASASWPTIAADESARVWLERDGDAHANDAMILERLALAVALIRARRLIAPDDSMATVLDATRPTAERAAAATRLRVEDARVRAVATAPDVVIPGPTALVATAFGVVRASIVRHDAVVPRGGLGRIGGSLDLASSWRTALLAFRLTDEAAPVVDADQFGVLLDAVLAAEADGVDHPDVRMLATLDAPTLTMLDALAHAESVRAAATVLHLHHSTLQTRHEAITRDLGYDPRSPVGRARYEVAKMLHRLTTR
ncbi:helix-turn-helix domain-containing protein [Herbiconiux sp. UC225_62]|uniref:helix-turn-helix domain-containing protein n=1 Tax=Herbiconiux sp. UC225_62 TaxID=3350168 RepID=UPI0036D31DBB